MPLPLPETALEPDIRICDPHHHLMDMGSFHYGIDEFLSDLGSGHRITRTIYMECIRDYRRSGPEALRPVGETEAMAAIDAPPGVMAGIVGYADLRLGERAAEVIEAHQRAGGKRFVGVRFMAAWDADPALIKLPHQPAQGDLTTPEFHRGVAELTRRGLPLDVWVFSPQLDDVVTLAKSCPDQIIVLDHAGSPPTSGSYAARRDAVLDNWRQGLRKVAECANVMLKVGGLPKADANSSTPQRSADIAGYWQDDFNRWMEWFGPSRCMFESNFPVERPQVSYAALWNAYKRLSQSLTTEERNGLFHDNAVTTYGL